ncbi:Knottin scorpion toxin-like superfamily [Arabidopsis thaliana x Arabidopsis arenosa]|uniref:Knottin scorpion toxin-like superfamily n=1 Tax=Arabidopsis thaliana x Arabidopsis arenosa TaxID=1240361 RepID=A0A8T1Y956_9BRAS|nr:Knottin scorpion toxin-like superfamily [Arabidopsis thaliana x Arabidopsis arenosa]
MAKFASIIFFFFAALVVFASLEAPMVEAKLCERSSGTWSGVCGNNNACKNQCINLEGARHGSCNYRFPYHRCICYFDC